MTLDAAALALLLRGCAPQVGPRTMSAIVLVESGRDPNAIYDNTSARAYTGLGSGEAIATARALLARGDVLDMGLAQVDSANLARVGLDVSQIFDPCANVRAGASILGDAYRAARERFGSGQRALRRAIGAYNTGSIFAGERYISLVLAAAGVVRDDPRMPDLVPLPSAPSAPAARVPAARTVPNPARRPPRRVAPARVMITPFTAPVLAGVDAGRSAFVPSPDDILPPQAQSPIGSQRPPI